MVTTIGELLPKLEALPAGTNVGLVSRNMIHMALASHDRYLDSWDDIYLNSRQEALYTKSNPSQPLMLNKPTDSTVEALIVALSIYPPATQVGIIMDVWKNGMGNCFSVRYNPTDEWHPLFK
jgi:hypothetical protein